MRDDISSIVRKPPKHEGLRAEEQNPTEDNSQPQVLDHSMCQDSRMSQRIADCHIPVKGHGQDKT